jgi:LAO/AO transport system kinase
MVSEDLIKKALRGDKRAVARLITYAENYPEKAQEVIASLYPYTGKAYVVGITGPPGCGKSTLIDKMIKEYRKRDKKVGVIAIDPTSVYTGGAFLGDRIRMTEHSTDKEVFIRSMATRGSFGGISKAAYNAVKILDASGKDIILVETVGAGQTEVDVTNIVYTTVVVTVPNMGDYIQTLKAGMIEIADIFVVNKADITGVDKTVLELKMMLQLYEKKKWIPPIVKTTATKNKGIKKLIKKIGEHKKYMETTKLFYEKQKRRCEEELLNLIKEKLEKYILESRDELGFFVEKILKKEIDPYSAANEIVKKIRRNNYKSEH